MTVEELCIRLDDMIKRGAGAKSVVITLADPSIGDRAKADIISVFEGFDWESDQVRLEPSVKLVSESCKKLVRKANSKLVVDIKGRYITVYHCPKCNNKLSRTANYCSKCGTAVIIEK